MDEPQAYSLLGEVLDEMARRRGVCGPEEISERLWWRARFDVSEESVYEYLHGYDRPYSDFMRAFREAFGLTEQEADEVAYAYTFHKRLPDN